MSLILGLLRGENLIRLSSKHKRHLEAVDLWLVRLEQEEWMDGKRESV